jgi:hypothetical protein
VGEEGGGYRYIFTLIVTDSNQLNIASILGNIGLLPIPGGSLAENIHWNTLWNRCAMKGEGTFQATENFAVKQAGRNSGTAEARLRRAVHFIPPY